MGRLEVILDHGAVIDCFDLPPHRLKGRVCLLQKGVNFLFRIFYGGECVYISCAGVNVDEIRVERLKLRAVKHDILEILGVTGFVEFGLNAVVQKKKLQNFYNVMRGRAAKDGDASADPVCTPPQTVRKLTIDVTLSHFHYSFRH